MIFFDPLWPPMTFLILTLIALLLLVLAKVRGHRIWPRLLVFVVFLLMIANPAYHFETATPLPNIGLVLIDESASMDFPDRQNALAALTDQLQAEDKRLPELDLVIHRFGNKEDGETNLSDAMKKSLADISSRQLAGLIILSDGQWHDTASPFPPDIPIHFIPIGAMPDQDQRIQLKAKRRYGNVGEPIDLTVTLTHIGKDNPKAPTPVTITGSDGKIETFTLAPGKPATISQKITHAGTNYITAEILPSSGERSLANNITLASIEGIRDRLKVLLVSGAPHAGERSWRNLLKSDPAINLIHFTILRPPEKQDGTPLDELSLIAFPVDELFQKKLYDFDLVIFDRFDAMSLLPEYYFDNLVTYVEKGGALLDASGIAYQSADNLATSSLRDILPGQPTGQLLQEKFRPRLSKAGEGHPITAPFQKMLATRPWGSWFLQAAMAPELATGTDVLLTGIRDTPLLLVRRVEKGRIASMTSDQFWLWSRGYEGGGPTVEWLRRLTHWLMQEPELDERQIRLRENSRDTIIIERWLYEDAEKNVTLTTPEGEVIPITLTANDEATMLSATLPKGKPGLYRLKEGATIKTIPLGPFDSKEYQDMTTSDALFTHWQETRRKGYGAVHKNVSALSLSLSTEGGGKNGQIIMQDRGAKDVTAEQLLPLLPPLLTVFLGLFVLAGLWFLETKQDKKKRKST
jgi:hypothetical protein